MSIDLRLRAGAAALVAAPGLMLAGHLTQLTPEKHDTASELAAIAGAPSRADAALVIGFLGLLCYIPAFLAMASPLRGRRTGWIGLTMSISGLLALVALMGSGPVTNAMVAASADRSEMIALTNRYESSPVVTFWVILMLVGWTLGPLVMGIGLWRAGWSIGIPLALFAGIALTMADAGRWPLALAFCLTWLGMALVAKGLWVGAASRTHVHRAAVESSV